MLDSCTDGCKTEFWSNSLLLCSCNYVTHHHHHIFGRTYYKSTDFVHIKLIRHNLKTSYHHHDCNG